MEKLLPIINLLLAISRVHYRAGWGGLVLARPAVTHGRGDIFGVITAPPRSGAGIRAQGQ